MKTNTADSQLNCMISLPMVVIAELMTYKHQEWFATLLAKPLNTSPILIWSISKIAGLLGNDQASL